ncbi:glycosyltransferase family 2 protein [Mesorhizobium sp. BAC0120]|uniref:glycosyltransferase family 2 protein n=1 Tax=Mesorhizobium sp. BAC0120 TaxID=3090670 RepID=UPI00298D01CB|nr:glycosyltransferase family 2 protein [Mesorhizobium sp. BAC0120]MDW6025483.1 glycosyltransferase family 2 protein [Mesorhizobium sp. BAC0120]
MPGSEISIIVPTYNEARNIEPLVGRLAAALPGLDWEVLFVDDNSPDGTADVVRAVSRRDDRVRLVLRFADRGLAKASIQGLLSANGEVLCVMDGDGQHDPAVIESLIEPLRKAEADVVSAARRLSVGLDASVLAPVRTRLSLIGNRLSNLVLGRDVADPLTGFFAIRRDAFLSVAPSLGDPGFKLLLDILSSDHKLRHREVPFDFGARMHGESKLDSFVAWQFATYLLSRLTNGIVPASLISFLIVGGSGVFVHLAVLYLALAATGSFALSQGLAALAAVTSNFLLNNRLTFRDRRLKGIRLASGYLKFLLVSSVGVLANVSFASFTYENIGHIAFVAALAGIALDTLWKFVISSRIVWK